MRSDAQSVSVYERKFSELIGFLPEICPLDSIHNSHFLIYENVLSECKQWYSDDKGKLRNEFDKAFGKKPAHIESIIEKLNYWQSEKLFAIVTTLSHLYRWNYLPAPEKEYARTSLNLPRGLNYLLETVCSKLGRLHCGSLWSTTISNYSCPLYKPGDLVDSRLLNDNNTKILHSWFSGYEHDQLERWIKVFVLFEAEGSTTLDIIIKIIKASIIKDISDTTDLLSQLNDSIKRLIAIFSRHTKLSALDKNLWREKIQPTFIWGIAHNGEILEGASGLQLGVTQIIDSILNIPFESKMGKALLNSRRYMPAHHQELLTALDYDKQFFTTLLSEQSESLNPAYHACLDSIRRFRVAHMQIGKKYIEGNGSPKNITTTGMSMSQEKNPIQEFQIDMQDRINETDSCFEISEIEYDN